MSKRFTSFLVLAAAVLLAIPAQAQVAQKASKAQVKTFKTAKFDKQAAQKAKEVQLKATDKTVGISFAKWDWAAHATPQYVSKSNLVNPRDTQKSALSRAEVFNVSSVLSSAIGIARDVTMRKNAPRRSLGLVTPPASAESETYYTSAGKFYLYGSNGWEDQTSAMKSVEVIVDGTDIYIAGLAYYVEDAWIKGTLNGTTATFPASQQVDDDEDYPEWINGSSDGQTVSDIVFEFDQEAGTLTATTQYIGECAVENTFSLYGYWTKPTFSKNYDGPQVVELPAGVELVEYALTYENSDGSTGSGAAAVAVDGNDVYFKGFSTYLPDALIKGTKSGNTITFPANQYLGNYSGYDSYLYVDATFTYDAATDTYSSTDHVYSVLGGKYYDANYYNPVLKGVVEKAATPANPAITALTDSQYGYYIVFNVPNVDTDGDGLVASKLFYEIYTDTEHDVQPLTFTSATHVKLTEDLTIIPFGFTEGYDFYDTQIYLNDLYSADWNKIGIKSIYTGGGETHETEIQWFDIKDYASTDNPDDPTDPDDPDDSDVITAPYTADFSTQDAFNDFTVLDNNNDGKTWSWSSANSAYYEYSSSNAADDYLILPIKLQAGKSYDVIVNASANGTTFHEKFEVVAGKEGTAAALTTTIIPETELATPEGADYDGSFYAEETGIYYVAIHATSDADKWRLKVYKFQILVGAEPTAPAAATDLTATAGAEGALEVSLAFTAPATAINGSALTGTEDVKIYRDDELVNTLTGVAVGSAQTWKDTNVEDGKTYTYYVVASNADGDGQKSEKVSVYVGQDELGDVQNFAVVGTTANTVSFAWDEVAGKNGGYVNKANVEYTIYTMHVESNGYWYYLVKDEAVGSVTNETNATVNFPVDEGTAGYQYFGISAKTTADNETDATAAYDYVIVGAPEELPIEEGFAGSSFHYNWNTNGGAYISSDATDGDGVALKLISEEDNQTIYFELDKVNLKSAANPTLLFDVHSGNISTVYAIGSKDGAQLDILQTITGITDEYQTVKVPLTAIQNSTRYSSVGFAAQFVESSYVSSYGSSWGDTLIVDNIKIVDLLQYNLQASVSAPKSVQAGQKATITATVKNTGENAAKDYTVTIKADDEILAEETVSEELASFASKEFTAELETTVFDEGDKNITVTVEYANDLDEDDNTAEAVITVKASSAAAPESVTATQDGEDADIVVNWTAPSDATETVTDDVEAYTANDNGGLDENVHTGTIGEWTVYDGNEGKWGYGFDGIESNLGNPGSWMIFNPGAISADLGTTYPAHSGDQYFISAACAQPDGAIEDTDNWLISPELPGIAQSISFYVRELVTNYGAETYEVLASSTDKNIESFTLVEAKSIATQDWTEVSFDLPAGTKYFAIRHTSNDVWALLVDDITYLVGGGEVTGYNIYLDGELVATVEGGVTTYNVDVEGIESGDHEVSVSAVYGETESKPVTVTVSVTTAISEIVANGQAVDVYSLDGKLLRQQTRDFSGLKGVYVINGKAVLVK